MAWLLVIRGKNVPYRSIASHPRNDPGRNVLFRLATVIRHAGTVGRAEHYRVRSFVGCTVAPGFDFADFEMGERENLLSLYPQFGEEIVNLID